MRHPYTQGLFRSIPLPGADKNSRPLISIPGQLPLPHERPKGCNFGPRCQHFVEGVCNAAEIPMIAVDGHDNHYSRCVRFNEIDWTRCRRTREEERAGQARRAGAQDRRSAEILQGRRQRDVRRRRGPRRQGQRDDQFSARIRDRGDRRRIRLRQVDAGQGAARAGDGELRHDHARQQGNWWSA